MRVAAALGRKRDGVGKKCCLWSNFEANTQAFFFGFFFFGFFLPSRIAARMIPSPTA